MSLNELKLKLAEFIHQHSIAKFEAEDIVELVAEGENIDWIVDQLKNDARINVDVDALTSLLTEIGSQVGLDKKTTGNETAAEPEIEPDMLDIDSIDPSQLDLSQIGSLLPKGAKLPPGLDAEGIKSLIESPQGKIMADFLVFCQEKGDDISEKSLKDPRTERLQNEWLSTPRDAFEGKTPAEMLARAQGKVATFRRDEPRVGRNDPCPCGSGKKFKKCCGRA